MDVTPSEAMQALGCDDKESDTLRKANSHFKKFCPEYQERNMKRLAEEVVNKGIEELDEAEIAIEIVQCFAKYVTENLKSYNSARTYFGASKKFLSDKYPSLEYTRLNKVAITSIHKKINKVYSERCVESNTKLVEHFIPVSPSDNLYIVKYLFLKGKYEESSAQALDWHNLGRFNEVVARKWTDLSLDLEESTEDRKCLMKVMWYRGKTSLLTWTNNIVHASNWWVCTFNSIARLCVLSKNGTSPCIFPNLNRVNAIIKMNNANEGGVGGI